MSSITAQIWVGHPDIYHPGINPTHYLLLSENDRPAWILLDSNVPGIKRKPSRDPIIWIPSMENMLEDAFLMVGIYIVQNQEMIKEVKNLFNGMIPGRIELYADLKKDDLKLLYVKNRESLKDYKNLKLVITILKGSHIANKLKALNYYNLDIEVCKSKA